MSGLLWSFYGQTVEVGIREAMARYYNKYGIAPNFIQLNPEDYDSELVVDGVEVQASKTTAKGHLFLGRTDRATVAITRNPTHIIIGSEESDE